MLAASSGKPNVTVWRPSVCLSRWHILNVTHQGAPRNAASVHFHPSNMWTDILVFVNNDHDVKFVWKSRTKGAMFLPWGVIWLVKSGRDRADNSTYRSALTSVFSLLSLLVGRLACKHLNYPWRFFSETSGPTLENKTG